MDGATVPESLVASPWRVLLRWAWCKPVMREQIHELHRVVIANDNQGVGVPRIDLGEKLTAPSTGCENAVIGHGDNRFDLRFARLDHVRGGGVLGAESETAAQMDADSRVDGSSG